MLAALIASVIPLYLAWSALSLYNNVRRAKASGLRVHVSPISTRNPLWMLFQPAVIPVLERLGVDTDEWLKLTKRSWNFHDRYRMHERYGKVFAHATPSDIEVFVADAAASDELLARKRDFLKPMHMVQIINVYGPSVASTDGADWSRHRRITATPFNERNNRIVWGESLRQTAQLLAYFERGVGANGSTGMLAEDSMTLTLNILTAAGLGFSCDFRGAEEKTRKDEGEKNAERGAAVAPGYRDCLAAVLEDFLPMGLLPKVVWSAPQWLMPKALQEYDLHKQTLKRFMVEMVEKTRYEGSEHANLLSVLVQKNEEARQQQKEKAVRGLSDDELYGNVFIYSFAGHETTAHAVCYAMYLLAAYPEVQDWVAEEAQSVLGTAELEHLSYDEIFPRLKRALGVMYETLRLYPPVLSIPKTTGPSPQLLTIPSANNLTATIPAHACVFPNVVALQSDPDYWGADSLLWNPARWIEKKRSGDHEQQEEEEEESIKPPPVKGSFIPWADGPRVCPGKKFSQVEFVAVVAAVLRAHRVEVVPRGGESGEEARKRILEVVEDTSYGATLFMRHPEKVRVRIVRR